MRNPFRRQILSEPGQPRGVVRVDARTKKLTKRLQPGQIAVIDHTDLDRVAAEALVECAPAAVLNASPSVSGRYPNLGPGILLEAGIPLVDDLGPDVMRLREGQEVVVEISDEPAGPEAEPAAGSGVGSGQSGTQAASGVPAGAGPAGGADDGADEADADAGADDAGDGSGADSADGSTDSNTESNTDSSAVSPDGADSRDATRPGAARSGRHAAPAAPLPDPAQAPRLAQVRLVSTGQVIAQGHAHTPQSVAALMEDAKAGLAIQLEAFAANTMEYMRGERDLLLNGVGLPTIRTQMNGRHVLVVVRGYSYKEDLAALRPYVREYKPVIIGVDGGADAVLEAGMKPDMIVGDMDSVSDKALRCGAEVVVHAYRDGRAPGLSRVEELGVEHVVFAATGTSEDIAMLMADAAGAELIVAVGTHATLTEFLDKGRAGMSSTFLTRLKVGSRLVDAKGVSRLYRTRISGWQLALLALAGLIALGAALASTPTGQTVLGLAHATGEDLVNLVRGLLGLAPSTPSV